MCDDPLHFSYATEAVPGKSLDEKCDRIKMAGCQGFEGIVFPDSNLVSWQKEIQRASSNHGLKPIVIILGNLSLYKAGEMTWVREALPAIAELGAAALLTPEYRAQDPIPLFPPYPKPEVAEQVRIVEAMGEISQIASRLNFDIYCEPLHPFISRFWRNVDDTLDLCIQLNNPRVGLVLDFNNMNMTETSIAETVNRAGKWILHMHLAENNRLMPGQGHINFAEGLQALKQINYSGWFSFECVASNSESFEVETRKSIELISRLWLDNGV